MKGEGIMGGAKIDTRGWREDRYARSAMARWIKLSISIVQRTGDQQDGKCAMTGIGIDSAVNYRTQSLNVRLTTSDTEFNKPMAITEAVRDFLDVPDRCLLLAIRHVIRHASD